MHYCTYECKKRTKNERNMQKRARAMPTNQANEGFFCCHPPYHSHASTSTCLICKYDTACLIPWGRGRELKALLCYVMKRNLYPSHSHNNILSLEPGQKMPTLNPTKGLFFISLCNFEGPTSQPTTTHQLACALTLGAVKYCIDSQTYELKTYGDLFNLFCPGVPLDWATYSSANRS